jgi:hypothetical protein
MNAISTTTRPPAAAARGGRTSTARPRDVRRQRMSGSGERAAVPGSET